LVGSTTTLDDDGVALDAVMTQWTSASIYSARVSNLRANELPVAAVVDDGASDTLTGGLGMDWFLTFAGDTADVTGAEESN
jgi:hypothetical protein